MENKELETWLKETKAKNLNRDELYEFISLDSNCSIGLYSSLKEKFNLNNQNQLTDYLFNQWQQEAEFSPKRGDRVLVYNNGGDEENRIFVAKIKNAVKPIIYVLPMDEQKFLNNEQFRVANRDFMKPLPIEQPIETDFKSKFEKVIELIEKRIDESVEKMKSSANDNSFQNALAWKIANQECGQLLKQIKQL